jgi:hypothetical protein
MVAALTLIQDWLHFHPAKGLPDRELVREREKEENSEGVENEKSSLANIIPPDVFAVLHAFEQKRIVRGCCR